VTPSGGTDKSGIAPDEIQPVPITKNLGRRRAAGIYGAIVTAAILDTVGGHVPTAALAVSVVVTLLVYWLAEEYAEVLGEQVEGGRLPSTASVRQALAATWPMVSASFAPLVALVGRLASAGQARGSGCQPQAGRLSWRCSQGGVPELPTMTSMSGPACWAWKRWGP
jgi:hypothetical protein